MKKAVLGIAMTFAMPCMAHPQFAAHDHSAAGSYRMMGVGLAVIVFGLALWRRKETL